MVYAVLNGLVHITKLITFGRLVPQDEDESEYWKCKRWLFSWLASGTIADHLSPDKPGRDIWYVRAVKSAHHDIQTHRRRSDGFGGLNSVDGKKSALTSIFSRSTSSAKVHSPSAGTGTDAPPYKWDDSQEVEHGKDGAQGYIVPMETVRLR
jgi:hypothetical protein